ncbi:MAG: Rpn family recombination-promoting nuclease/putative transposase, partial [Azoarcus sp.]|nr:Rpn family recombination-promoting nuclease/putative transposase [Azoarcus sp.]
IGKGEEYEKIKPSVCILITNFELVLENRQYHNRYRLRDSVTGSEFTDLMEVNTLELPKLPDNADGTPSWDWLEFLKTDSVEVYEMLSDNNPEVKKAVVRLKELSAEETARLVYEARLKAKRDQYAREKFVRQETILTVAQNLLKLGRPLEEIAQATGLSVEEIRSLLH